MLNRGGPEAIGPIKLNLSADHFAVGINEVVAEISTARPRNVTVKLTVSKGNSSESLSQLVEMVDQKKVRFNVRVVDHGEYLLRIVATTSGSGSAEATMSVRTFSETPKITKLSDLRNKKFDSFYFSNKNINVFETSIKIQGDLMGDKLKNVEKFM
jgi:hypothetical protein